MIDVQVKLARKRLAIDVALTLNSRVTAIFGPSGAGKTTLFNMIAGIVQPTSGHIVVIGARLFDAKQGVNVPIHQRNIGVVFQDHRLFPHLTVEKNLRYSQPSVQAELAQTQLSHMLSLLELTPLLQQKPYQLSGGEKQRVALGRALMSNPRLLILDEPLASLDTRLKAQILPFLKRVTEEVDVPMLYISHSMDEIHQIAEHVAYMEQGVLHANL